MSVTFDEEISSLRAIFPHIAPEVIRNVLLSQHGNMEQAVSVLLETPEQKTSVRELSAFELRKILVDVDLDLAEHFYAHGLDGEAFLALTSDETKKYGIPLKAFALANLKKGAKEALVNHQESPEHDQYIERPYIEEDEKTFETDAQNLVYVVTVPTMVRETKELSSEPVGGLAPGTAVEVKQIDGLRVEITDPLEGWISSRAQNGIRILLQMQQEDLDHLLAQQLQNPQLYEAQEDDMVYAENVYQYQPTFAQEPKAKKTGMLGSLKSFASRFSKKQDQFDFEDDQFIDIVREEKISTDEKATNI